MALPVDGATAPVIQNLGPGKVCFDADEEVTMESGFELGVGAVYEYPRDLNQGTGKVFLVADQADTDVRYLAVG